MANATKVDGLTTPEVDIDRLHIIPGQNPRTSLDPDALAGLKRSIERVGVLEPLIVKPDGEGFGIVAGERRWRAAKAAGCPKVPVTTSGADDPSAATAAENDHREEPDAVARARGWAAVREEHDLRTIAELADYVGFGPKEVGAHLRLLELPEGVRDHIAAGIVPMSAEPLLREVAKVSPRVAECVCELARRQKVEPGRFAASFGDLLRAVPGSRFQDPPEIVPTFHVALRDAVADRAERRRLVAEVAALYPDRQVDDTWGFAFSVEEIDAARAAGCLVEYTPRRRHGWGRTEFITDAALAADLTDRAIARIKGERERLEKEVAGRKGANTGADRMSEARKAQAAERRRRKADAQASNEEVGIRLLKARGGKAQKQRAMVRLRVLTALLVEAYPEMPARGLRLVLPQLRQVESKPAKSGKPREKVVYAGREEANEYLLARVAEAKTPEEGIEFLTEALVADEHAVPQADRLGHRVRIGPATEKALAADIRAATPPSRRAKK